MFTEGWFQGLPQLADVAELWKPVAELGRKTYRAGLERFVRYELYHDESKEDGYWHGMMLVPVARKSQLLGLLETARSNTGYKYPISLKKLRRSRGPMWDCMNAWIQIATGALRSVTKGEAYPVFLGQRERPSGYRGSRRKPAYERLRDVSGVKVIIFRERHGIEELSDYLDYGGKIETNVRMGLKGGLHYLGSEDSPIHIVKMHFDGHEHHKRHIDRHRVIGRMNGLRDYCQVENSEDVINDRSSDHTIPDSQDYADCQLLQLVDLLVGCFRTVLSEQKAKREHVKLAEPIKRLIERYCDGYARMRNSRWWSSLCLGQCHIESGCWVFSTFEFPTSGDRVGEQMALW